MVQDTNGARTPPIVIKAFVEATSGFSLRDAGSLVSVSHDTVSRWRKWVGNGAEPDDLDVHPATVRGVQEYLRISDDIEMHRGALRIAADHLEAVVRQLRKDADAAIPPTLSAATGDEVARRVDEAKKATREQTPEDRPSRRRA